jgi:hypothetical protein
VRFLCAALCAAFLATGAQAELSEGADWRNCSQDAQCIAIEGLCGTTAVNFQVKDTAARYYRERKKKTKCVERFWEPREQTVRCRLGSCETIPKQAATDKSKK